MLNHIASNDFCREDPGRFQPIIDALLKFGDHYMLLGDYSSYMAAQERVSHLFTKPETWARRAILNVAGMGPFSSDRSIREYADEVWKVSPVTV